MRPPFPGMDPWLEGPTIWADVHGRLITSIADELAPQLAPRYFVGVESRTTVLTGLDVDRVYRPDVSIHATESRAAIRGADVAVLERPEVQTFTVSVPGGEEFEETFLTIQELPGRKLVTVIEVLLPTNKKTKDGRAEYLKKRDDLMDARVNFVEIDLLRAGEPMPVTPAPPPSDYRILVCRAEETGRRYDYVSLHEPDPADLDPALAW